MKIFTLLIGLALFCPSALHAQEEKSAKFPANLKGKLIELKDGKAVDAELKGSPEFYVLYHSASW